MTRIEGRRRHAGRPSGAVPQRPFGQVERRIDWLRVISDDQVAAIHGAALTVLAEQGLRVLHPPARALFAGAGAQVQGDCVRLDPALVEERLKTVPPAFTLEARNPLKSLRVGGRHGIYASVGGPAYVMCNDKGRRDGSFAEMCDFLRLVQGLNVIHQEGGCPFEPLDLP
ncbi:MAG: trimethylamine methyltransferase family protein, partial [Paracoccaceae bacterium]|nr:trimethylamine methyltransferase family protein [Paracoccaceae bacterium]